MDRRAFVGTLAAAAAGLAFDPERLLWVPGAKKIFIPPAVVLPKYMWMMVVPSLDGGFTWKYVDQPSDVIVQDDGIVHYATGRASNGGAVVGIAP